MYTIRWNCTYPLTYETTSTVKLIDISVTTDIAPKLSSFTFVCAFVCM